jgi:cytochrome c-type biogenesis protein CcsB
MDLVVFKLALAIYFISAIGFLTSLYIRKILIARIMTLVITAGFISHTVFLILRYGQTGEPPIISLHEALSFFAWAVTGIYLAFQLKTKTRLLGAFVSPIVLLLMILASAGLGGQVTLPRILQGRLVPVHVVFSIMGEALFSLASLAGAMYLIQESLIKNKKTGGFARILPSLMDLDRINYMSLLWGFPLLTLGILHGSIWAQTVWGSLWQWDPKQLWTLGAWILYAVILHQRIVIGWKGHKTALFSLLAFGVLVVSLIATNIFLVTAHTFI